MSSDQTTRINQFRFATGLAGLIAGTAEATAMGLTSPWLLVAATAFSSFKIGQWLAVKTLPIHTGPAIIEKYNPYILTTISCTAFLAGSALLTTTGSFQHKASQDPPKVVPTQSAPTAPQAAIAPAQPAPAPSKTAKASAVTITPGHEAVLPWWPDVASESYQKLEVPAQSNDCIVIPDQDSGRNIGPAKHWRIAMQDFGPWETLPNGIKSIVPARPRQADDVLLNIANGPYKNHSVWVQVTDIFVSKLRRCSPVGPAP